MSDREILDRAERAAESVVVPDGRLEDLLRRRDRKRRNQRITAGVVGFAVFVAAIWIVTTGGPFDRAQTPGASGGVATGPSVLPDDEVGLIGLPPEGATPSTPESGELVLNFFYGHTMGDPGRFHVNVYADGRLLTWRLGFAGDGVEQRGRLEQRLTPEGVELLRSEVISTGLFDHDLRLASGQGLYFGQIEVRNGDQLVRVTWGDCCDPGAADEPSEMPTPEQASALQRLDARLADPASWLPASAWEDQEIKAYVASRYSVCLIAHGIGLSRILASFPRPAEDLLRTWDRTYEEIPQLVGLPLDLWCSDVTTEETRALAQILEDAGIQEVDFGDSLEYELQSDVVLSFGPLLPHNA